MPLKTGDDEILTPGVSTAVPLTAAKLRITNSNGLVKKCERVILTVEGYPIRVRQIGAPTSSLGRLLPVGGDIPVGGPYTFKGNADLTNLQMIGIGGQASVYVEYLYPE